jgi:hypothetical protein
MHGKIATITKTAQKKNANQKDIKLLNSANEVAACLVELVDTERKKNFSTLAEMHKHMVLGFVRLRSHIELRCD